MKNKKGFTLIELLAVIVVLAIVALLGYSIVLPLLERTRKEAFATEANNIVDAAQNAMTTISVGVDGVSYRTNTDGKYCFTLQDLVDSSLLSKRDLTGYAGQVIVTPPTGGTGAYTYEVTMKNTQYKLTATNSAAQTNVEAVPATDSATYDCSGYTAHS